MGKDNDRPVFDATAADRRRAFKFFIANFRLLHLTSVSVSWDNYTLLRLSQLFIFDYDAIGEENFKYQCHLLSR